jgi:Right handed beta helix region
MAVLTVGPGQQFGTIADAVAASSPGDTVDVQAGTYTNDFVYIGHSLTLQAVGGEVQMVATEEPPDGKAIITEGVPGANVAINGFDISGAAVGDQNGAAVRYEGGNLSLSNDYFHNNQEGLLAASDPNGTISINNSEFAFNGDGSGFTHGIYVNDIASLSVTNSYIHDTAEGHEIKSRAQNTTITNDRIFDNQSTASYSVDLPNGGNATISNNQIEQGPNSDNPYIIAYGEEGQSNPGTSVSIDNNTIVNDQTNNPNDAVVLNRTGTSLGFTDNQVWGLSPSQLVAGGGSLAESGTVFLASHPSLDTSSLSFINPSPSPSPSPTPSPTPSPDPSPSPAPSPSPGPTLSLDQYHAMVVADFTTYASAHPAVYADPTALGALVTELLSTTVLTAPVPGDLWS